MGEVRGIDEVTTQMERWFSIAVNQVAMAEQALASAVLLWGGDSTDYRYPDLHRHSEPLALIFGDNLYVVAPGGEHRFCEVGRDHPERVMKLSVVPLANVHRYDGEGGL